MMKIGIATSAYTVRYGFADGIRRLRADGYEAVDYGELTETESDLFRLSESAFEKELKRQRKIVEDESLEIFQTHGPWRFPPHDETPVNREERLEKMCKAVWGTALLGCKNMVIHPIMPFGSNQSPNPELFWSLNMEFMSKLAACGRENGVVICLENMPFPSLTLSRPSEILQFVREMDDPWFRICLDTGHCAVLGESPADAVRLIGKEYLQVLHVHDNNGARDMHWIPYTGVVDWEDFSKALEEIGYDGVMSLETAIPLNIPEEARKLQERSLFLIAEHIARR